MKYFISSILCYIFFFEISSGSKGCSISKSKSNNNEECESTSGDWKDQIPMDKSENELPEWILTWKSPTYGLEFQDKPELVLDVNLKTELDERETYSIIEDDEAVGKAIQDEMKSSIHSNIQVQRDKREPEFTIARMDPIEYEHDSKKMWLLLEEIKFENLDSFDNLSYYHQLPKIYQGIHKIKSERFHEVDDKMGKKDRLPKKKYEEKNNFVEFKRRDDSWKINLVGFFVNDEKKVTMEANFKIQPEPSEEFKSVEGFRQKGTVKLQFNKFYFDIEFVIKHIDVLLLKFLDEKIKCNNKVPDFNVDYHFSGIKIKKVTVQGYDEDIIEWKIPEQPQDVNPDPEPSEEKMKVKITKAKEKVRQEEIDENAKEIVEKHLNTVIDFISKKKDIVRKKLRANIMPKITWKIMKMTSKLQLPSLIYEVVKYEESFNPRLELQYDKGPMENKAGTIITNAVANKVVSFLTFGKGPDIKTERHKIKEGILRAKNSDEK